MNKDERQEIVIDKFIENNFIGGLKAATGFGKTITALKIIQRYSPESLIVVVPRLALQNYWQNILEQWDIEGTVLVINTASKNIYSCDMLILDEVHTVPAESFIEVFNTITYDKLIWLTATIERQDGNHKLILEKAPILDTISLEECLINNWISNYIVFIVELDLSESEKILYDKLTENANKSVNSTHVYEFLEVESIKEIEGFVKELIKFIN